MLDLFRDIIVSYSNCIICIYLILISMSLPFACYGIDEFMFPFFCIHHNYIVAHVLLSRYALSCVCADVCVFKETVVANIKSI